MGVAFGLERIILLADWKERLEAGPVPVFLAVAGEGLEEEALLLAREIRALGVPAEVELGGRSLKSQMKYAGKKVCPVIIIGSRELEQDRFLWRDMVGGSQVLVSGGAPAATARTGRIGGRRCLHSKESGVENCAGKMPGRGWSWPAGFSGQGSWRLDLY